jgi:mannose-6-phosphate isomerase-like protein (cupin superfamily)
MTGKQTRSFRESHACIAKAISAIERTLPLMALRESPAGNVIDFHTDRGAVTCFGLLKKPEYAVTIAIGSGGAIFPPHHHETSVEYLITLTGHATVTLMDSIQDDRVVPLPPGEGLRIDACLVHSVVFDQAGDILALTVPADEGYPDA